MPLLSKEYHDSQVKRAINGNYRPHGDIHQADSVIGVSFGYRQMADGRIEPSLSTRDVAHFVAAFHHLPKYLENGLAHAYKSHILQAETIIKSDMRAPLHAVNGGLHMNTKRLLHSFREQLIMDRRKHPALVGHPNHVAWLDYLCGQLGIETIVPAGLQHIRFDPGSHLRWTRTLENWQSELRERRYTADPDAYMKLFDSLRYFG